METKVAIVTGASGGIGTEIAKALARDGFSLALFYYKHETEAVALLKEVQKLGAPQAAIFRCDLRQSAAVEAAVSAVQKTLGKPSVLVNNAGIAQQKLFQDITDTEWHDMLGVSLDGAFYMTRAVLSDMLDVQSGRIINISSLWGEVGASCEVHYSAAKAGLIGMTKGLAKELAPSGITVNAVAPGAIRTKMLTSWGEAVTKELEEEIPLGRIGEPQEIAAAVAFLASEKAGYITGHVLSVNGGMVI